MTIDRAEHAKRKALRAERRSATKKTLERLRLAKDIAYTRIGELTGAGDTKVREWFDPSKKPAMSFDDALALPADLRLVLAELLAGPNVVIARVPEGDPRASVNTAAELLRASSDVSTLHLVAIADGVITGAEATPIRDAIHRTQQLLAHLDAAAARAERERVVSIDRRRTG